MEERFLVVKRLFQLDNFSCQHENNVRSRVLIVGGFGASRGTIGAGTDIALSHFGSEKFWASIPAAPKPNLIPLEAG